MNDQIKEVGKSLGKTKKNSEAALRRYSAKHPKIERIRDIFDDVVPFEMEFETERQDSTMYIDLSFNKPPPMRNCKAGNLAMICDDFVTTVGDGAHLLQVGSPYWPGTVSVFVNDVELSRSNYSEYDAVNGLVFVAGTTEPQNIVICFVAATWEYQCTPASDYGEGNTASLSANNDNPEFTGFVNADADPSTPMVPPYKAEYTSVADYEAYSSPFDMTVKFTSHLGSLDNLPPGESHLGAFGGFSIERPAEVNLENVTVSMQVENIAGDHIGAYLDFFPNPPEEASMTIQIGHTAVDLRSLHGDRSGFFPFLGSPQPARSLVRFRNAGPRKWDYEVADNDDDSFESPWFEYGFNSSTPVIFRIHRENNFIQVIAGGVSWTFAQPRFGETAITSIDVNWSANEWVTETAVAYGRVQVYEIDTCRFGPENA